MANIYSFDSRDSIEEDARRWLIRLDGDEPLSAEERKELHAWVERSPAHREELLRISAFWSDANVLTELSIPVLHRPEGERPKEFSPWRTLWHKPIWGAAATLCLLAVLLATGLWWHGDASRVSNGLYATAIGELRVTRLPDGSMVTINTDSQIQVDFNDQERKIRLLRGEAHFDVAHNSDRPFKVFAGEGMVKAVGTAFSVKLDSKEIEVVVTEGRVDLASRVDLDPAPGRIAPMGRTLMSSRELRKVASLEVGQTATMRNEVTAVTPAASVDVAAQVLKIVDRLDSSELERQLAWQQGYLVFAGEPLSQVVEDVNRYMPVTIEIADPQLRDLRIGGRFKVGELEAMFDVLESGFGIQVTQLDDRHIQLRKSLP
ncbi:DUF4880 domain-containing protein [Pseudomaricurvus alkylphenolicus]|uniref:FecR domain-containing protein n=1 Tax=Pseudomaricurvus alkylphenolicus TaxID=1306991 RepID=UPI0014207D14|nr:DUF4880 domain-containing protein [Pseudomaricurvus alkylphenolicus]